MTNFWHLYIMQKKFGQQGTPLENDWPHYHERLFFQKMPFPNDGIDGTRRIDYFPSYFLWFATLLVILVREIHDKYCFERLHSAYSAKVGLNSDLFHKLGLNFVLDPFCCQDLPTNKLCLSYTLTPFIFIYWTSNIMDH